MAAPHYYDMTVPEWPEHVTVPSVKAWVRRAVQVYPMCYIPHKEALLNESTIHGMESLVNAPLTSRSVLRYLKAPEHHKAYEKKRQEHIRRIMKKSSRSSKLGTRRKSRSKQH